MKPLTEILAMSPEEQRVKCAEVCGWRMQTWYNGIEDTQSERLTAPSGSPHETMPDYANSLDAMHEAEKLIENDREKMRAYRDALGNVKGVAWYQSAVLIHVSAAQRLAAFLSVLL